MSRKRVAVLISGRGSNMAALIEAAEHREYPAEISLVLSNLPEAAGLARAEAMGVPTAVVDHRPHGKDRTAFERALQGVLDEHRVELVCLGDRLLGGCRLADHGQPARLQQPADVTPEACVVVDDENPHEWILPPPA